MTLTEFLEARLDEDERIAKLAAREGGTWTQDDPERYPGAISSLGGTVVYDEGAPDENQAPHIARHDPARVLREVEADRKLLAALAANPDPEQDPRYDPVDTMYANAAGLHDGLLLAIRIRAERFSDHPDYDPAWASSVSPAVIPAASPTTRPR